MDHILCWSLSSITIVTVQRWVMCNKRYNVMWHYDRNDALEHEFCSVNESVDLKKHMVTHTGVILLVCHKHREGQMYLLCDGSVM